jgi:hypothetical protein
MSEAPRRVPAAGDVTTLLFPRSKGGVIKQQSFAQGLTDGPMTIKSAPQTASSSASSHISFATPSERE